MFVCPGGLRSAAGAWCVMIVLGACRARDPAFDWRVRFGEGTSPAGVTRVEAWIASEDCDGAQVWSADVANGAAAIEAPPRLAAGRYGFGARAVDDGCRVVAQGCETLNVPRDADAPVAIVLAPRGPTPLCDPLACQQARCTGAAPIGGSGGSTGVPPGCAAMGACPAIEWWHTFGAGRSDTVKAILAGADAITIAGQFRATVDFGGGVTIQGGEYAPFIKQLDGRGQGRWGRAITTGSGVSTALGLAHAADGTIVVTGQIEEGGDFGGGRVGALGGRDGFVAAYAADGAFRRALLLGGPGVDQVRAAAVLPDGGLVVVGGFDRAASFGATPRLTPSGIDVFVARLDAAWKVAWAVSFGSDGEDAPGGVNVSDDGRIFVAATLGGATTLGGKSLGAKFQTVPWLLALESDGRLAWTRAFGTTGKHAGAAIALGPDGAVYVSGTASSEVDFGAGLVPITAQTVFVARYDRSGALAWWRPGAGAIAVQAQALSADAAGVVATGVFSGPIDFGAGALAGAIDMGVFVVRYQPSGDYGWSRGFQHSQGEAFALTTDATGGVLVGGGFEGLMRFGREAAPSMSEDMFVMRLAPPAAP